jgi:MinD superfamily P-loop ATPase
MKELVIISGKGGTGKTSITGAFAALSENRVLCDADVDAADLHLLMNPEVIRTTNFMGGGIAVMNPDKCTGCGLCRELCRFHAIRENFEVNPLDCEGCGVCVDLCPVNAMDFPGQKCGEWFISETRFGPMVHARLGIAEENSGKLVALVRQEAAKLAEQNNIDLIITDGPPGIGCPVIASIGGASLLLIVSEPTVSGIHDMERVARLAGHFKVPALLCINKYDLNPDQTDAIEAVAQKMGVGVLGRVPFDPIFVESMVQGKTIFEVNRNTDACAAVKRLWKGIMDHSAMTAPANLFKQIKNNRISS